MRRLGDFEAAFEEGEEAVGDQREECGGDGAGEDYGVTHHGDAAEDEGAEAASSDGGGDCGDADGDDGGGANPGENYGEGERETDAQEDLRVGHAHGFGGLQDGRVDIGEADVSIAENRKQRVENKRDDRGARADAADEWDWNEEAEEREAGNCLKYAGDAEGDRTQGWALDDKHSERDSD